MVELTDPEQAALDAWNRGSGDTTGMLYAVRHALAAERRNVGPVLNADARERLARHLWVADAGSPSMWDRIADRPYADARASYYTKADVLLAVITGKED